MNPRFKSFTTSSGAEIFYLGPDLTDGPKPTVIYFALSATETLFVDPFNQPALEIAEKGIRVFSWNLPFHEEGVEPWLAMDKCYDAIRTNPFFLIDFIDLSRNHLNALYQQGLIAPHPLGVMGLSRGGFMATHLAAQDERIKFILGFSPITEIDYLKDFEDSCNPIEKINLEFLTKQLLHTQLRFYIGNNDERVSTDACYNFIKKLTQTFIGNGVRTAPVEMMISPSIGQKGHGTSPSIFKEGAEWLSKQILKKEI